MNKYDSFKVNIFIDGDHPDSEDPDSVETANNIIEDMQDLIKRELTSRLPFANVVVKIEEL